MLAATARRRGGAYGVMGEEGPGRGSAASSVSSKGAVKRLGVALVPTSAPDHFTEDTPTVILVRQVLGAIAQFDKATLVAKLKAARDRKRARTGKCGGRRSHIEARPEVVALARQLRPSARRAASDRCATRA